MALSYNSLLSLSVLLLLVVSHSSAFDAETEFCYPSLSTKSQIKPNVDQLLSNLTPKFDQGAKFVQSSYGKGKNKVYGLAQCRGRADPKICLDCIHDAVQEIQNLCPDYSGSGIWYNVGAWYDFCYIRYSTDQFYGQVDTSDVMLIGNQANVTNIDVLDKSLGKLFNVLTSNAVKSSNGGFAKGTIALSEFDTLYGIAECTKDLSSSSCAQCLDATVENFKGFCSGRKGCRVYYVNCNVRYETYPFFDTKYSPKGEKLEKVKIHKS